MAEALFEAKLLSPPRIENIVKYANSEQLISPYVLHNLIPFESLLSFECVQSFRFLMKYSFVCPYGFFIILVIIKIN